MGYTWNSPLMKKMRKKYSIDSFSKENQDKFALIILKHKRIARISKKTIDEKGWDSKFLKAHGDIIKYIINDNIEKVILTASLEWASLLGSP